jgi:signal transduction histidine kinase
MKGIGLAIAKKLVDRVGGKIWLATPASGKGLAIYFTWLQFPVLKTCKKDSNETSSLHHQCSLNVVKSGSLNCGYY